ncbi:MAG TPA: ornithine cyclodeaminase family protein [Lichenihabitans sp.]|jgi:ornithine cyclodeaminase|nr:ornithine cyclodeaminase family protein [Lichenihabitans sp.]
MRIISREDLDRLLTFPQLIGALHDAFTAGGAGPARHHHSIGDGERAATHLLMPAWTSDAPGPGSFLGTKVVNVFPGNRAKNLPSVLGAYLLQSGETGAPLAVMDGTRLTHWRTAAASALAARFLARDDARRLTMIGAGALAPFLVRAHASVRPIDHVTVWNHRLAGAEALVREIERGGIEAVVAQDLEAAVAEADIVSCATLSSEPIVRGAWLNPGVHLDLVGAFSMAMRETDGAAVARARVYVDTQAALEDGGDVALALREGCIARSDVVGDLHALCRGVSVGRREAGEITLFKSVGTAIEDLAAAVLVWRLLHAVTP